MELTLICDTSRHGRVLVLFVGFLNVCYTLWWQLHVKSTNVFLHSKSNYTIGTAASRQCSRVFGLCAG